ncbi:TOBE domain-containing protein [Halorussus salilacus]|uniref:TOBE domain-containing protein n=1 Tax=Halorussus salilacus TaxID=2953750 RepID=UPI0020A12100|nr:TOBE domain-containing protein [Halorussus salilacus]USZ66908.1 TOBE domain-containing protein [Halorussus salilacus]
MTLTKDFEPRLAIGETTVTSRDVEMLRGIDEHGSMYGAANELGRSYPHLQRRVVELEAAVGPLTRRVRGGKDGGGTQLTDDARDLIQRFERLRIELSGVTTVPESVISGTVTDRDGQLATVRTAAGDVSARLSTTAEEVEIAVRADAVVLMSPRSPWADHTSLRNRIPGVVSDLAVDDTIATVTVEVADGVTIRAVVTTESVDRLDIEEGRELIAAFKTTAARATPVDT